MTPGTTRKIVPNKNQQKCIKTLDGPVMVLAGPGTGKTFTVIERIKYMISIGIKPETILCLTYSEAAAGEMKTRLVKEAGTSVSSVSIHTYHAFCSEVIRYNPVEFELLDGISLADDITKQTLMSEALKEYKPEFYLTKWGDCDYYVPELLKATDKIKKSLITKEKYFNNLKIGLDWQVKMDALEKELIERKVKNAPLKSFMSKYEAHKKKMGKAKEAWEIYELYNTKLKQNNLIDFNDMINMVLEVFESNDDLLKRVSANYRYFLVDEYQDTNYVQNNIVFKLAEGAGCNNIFVVGDDDQIIYEFQGAKTDTLAKFLIKFPDAKVICLDENNRSAQNILDFSYKVISQDKTRLEFNPDFQKYKINKQLTAKNPDICILERPIKLHSFQESVQEANYIVEEIENLISSSNVPKNKSGETDLSAIAVLARTNEELEKFAELFKSKNIRYQMKTTNSIFEIKPSILIYFYLKALYNHAYYSEKLFGLLGAEPFAIEPEDYMYLLLQNRLNHKDFIENIKLNLDYTWKGKEKIEKFITTYDRLKKLQSKVNIKNFVITVCNETGILDYYVNSEINKTDNILAIKRIIDEAGAYRYLHKSAILKDFIEHLDLAYKYNIPITTDKEDFTQNAVQLLTLHGSKGRQFDYVYIPNLTSSRWEKKRNKTDGSLPIFDNKNLMQGECTGLFSKNETGAQANTRRQAENLSETYNFVRYNEDTIRKSELLRLLFVGITRAKYDLTLSYSNTNNGKEEEFTSLLIDAVKELNVFEFLNHELDKDDYAHELMKSLKQTTYDYSAASRDEIQTRVNDIVLSPSTLNCYLNCPRQFFYSYVLKIPVYETNWDSANYGSAIHKTLENAVIYLKNNEKYPNIEEFIADFCSNIDKEEFETEKIREIYKKRGKNSLYKYYPHFIETSGERINKAEYTFEAVPIGKNFVTGKIDRIERNSDGSYCLFDYKTGDAKPKSQIADGREYERYLNQLRFYKCAFETLNPNSPVELTGLIFPEDFEHNFYIKFTNEDNIYITKKITETYEKIRNMEFLPVKECEKTCKYCVYKQLCRLQRESKGQ